MVVVSIRDLFVENENEKGAGGGGGEVKGEGCRYTQSIVKDSVYVYIYPSPQCNVVEVSEV